METLVVPASGVAPASLQVCRDFTAEQWVDQYGSGSLQKARSVGMVWRPLYLQERTAFEWGWGFKVVPRSRVTFGDAVMEGDCSALTETVWHAKRGLTRNQFPEDFFEVKYLTVHHGVFDVERGVGLILRQTSAQWLPGGHIVYAVLSEEYNPLVRLVGKVYHGLFGTRWSQAQNPW